MMLGKGELMGINAFYFKTKIAWLTLYKLILSNLAI